MQEGYFREEEGEARKEVWEAAAEMMKSVNDQVLEDIEDYILLEGFGGKS